MEVDTQELLPTPVSVEVSPEPVAAPEELKPEPSPPSLPSFDEWFSQLDSNPDLKATYDERQKQREKEISVQEYRKFQSHIQPSIDRWTQNSQQTQQTLRSLWNGIQKAVADGTLEPDTIAEALQSNRAALDAFNSQMWWEGTFYTLSALGKAVEDEQLANEFLGRLWKMATENKPDPDFANNLLERIATPLIDGRLKEAEDKGYKRGLGEGKKVNQEESRAKTRQKESGPDLTDKETPTAAGIKTMEDADAAFNRGKIDIEAYRGYRKQFGVKERY